MAKHSTFRYPSLEAFQKEIKRLKVDLPLSTNTDILSTPVPFGRLTAPNRFSIHPMEGCDALPDGSPSELTYRRYRRFGAGGAGLLWVEACAVVEEGKANPRQISINEKNLKAFEKLVKDTRKAARETMGAGHNPVLILQMTHSGRYSKPYGKPRPIIAHHSKVLDKQFSLPPDYPLITDDELDRLQEKFVKTARLAAKAGFDGVDVKSCHRYLVAELHASFMRKNSRYGGSFESRTRFLRETAAKVISRVPGVEVSCRLNAYDAIEYPYGFGTDKKDIDKPDLRETKKLVGMLADAGFNGINISIGNPYWNPHYGRPFDEPIEGMYVPKEHPLQSMARFVHVVKELQQSRPDLTVIGGGYSWSRQYLPYLASGVLEKGWASIVGVGREAFAYPDFARDFFTGGRMDPQKCCITCSACTQIMRDGGTAGCVPKDAEVYGPIFRAGRMKSPEVVRELARQCRDCAEPTCVKGCPAGIDIPGFVTAIADGKDRKAYEIIRQSNSLPETCSYVCPVEVQCEGSCVQMPFRNTPVPIKELQKYVCEKARKEGWTAVVPGKPKNKKVAVVGAGPAGIACAVRLIGEGYRVTIFDANKDVGGIAANVIPAYRLAYQTMAGEVAAILDTKNSKGLTWKLGAGLSTRLSLATLQKKFDAVFLATGLSESVPMKLSRKEPKGVVGAIDFLKKMKTSGARVPDRVAVIGGGNSAMDAALTAKKAGAEDVYVLYRRTFKEMPAWPEERDKCVENGVNFLVLSQPVAYIRDGKGNLKGIKVARTRLGAPDASGRRRPETMEKSEYTLDAQLCVEAVGQAAPAALPKYLKGVTFNRNGTVKVNEYLMTDLPGVFAGGDMVNGGNTVVKAVADGHRAADAIEVYLK